MAVHVVFYGSLKDLQYEFSKLMICLCCLGHIQKIQDFLR
jgi:hypothetical protein